MYIIKYWIKGRLYSQRSFADLPINAHDVCTTTHGDVTVFAGRFSRLSNLHPVKLQIDGSTWDSVEQYYQAQKALAAGEQGLFNEIRLAIDPQEAMELGRGARPGPEWQQQGPVVMKRALLQKFQLPKFKNALRGTSNIIGEATRNSFWGTGKTMSDPSAGDPGS